MESDTNIAGIPNPDLPAPPMPTPPGSSLVAALKEAAVSAAVVGAFAAIGTKIPLLNKFFTRSMREEAIDAAVIGGAIGGVVGYSDNETARHVTYPLQVENTLLKQELIKAGQESYAQRIAAEKQAAQSSEPSR